MGDDDVRFVIDLSEKPTNAASRPSAKSLAKPASRDRSFEIGGAVSYPPKSQPAFPEISSPKISSPKISSSRPTTVTHPAQATLHIALRIPRKMLDDIDAMARERNTSMSQVIRTSLAK